jgi:predicted NUDIX family NTP pyrophosphohydrolase
VPVRSAGILLWRRTSSADAGDDELQVLIAHMGGPFWTGKDDAAWSVPKGEYVDAGSINAEQPLDAAVREWEEELGVPLAVPVETLVALGEVKQPSGKRLSVWAGEGDLDPAAVVPGMFTMQWPPRSGKMAEFPEIDRVEWCDLELARRRLVAGQRVLLDLLVESLR